ncbi:MAG: hypothetical protein MJ156_00305 [Alphaproteobacteria bacterium]|nr:hypothetical protein [Alphaproteobacteria bacterium]
MRIQANFIVTDKQTKQGTSTDGRDWKLTEYVLKENVDASQETLIPATASSSVEDLTVGAEYECTLFVNSRKFIGKDDIERLYPSFRIASVKKIKDAPEADSNAELTPADLEDSVPF